MVIALAVVLLAQGPAAFAVQYEHEAAAHTVYAACLFRENDRRRAASTATLDGFVRECKAERDEIVRLEREAERKDDVVAAGLRGFEETMRQQLARMNRFYPTGGAHVER